ncbi:MAG: hypothetical protein KME04_00080 [Pleurocapsa minor GSE-CHR-MK-17-07R]|jgi:hypothetical protein|nr:hypothetical protein [Pleurocapsa minor GSE-CHR-MK 17-07R]
MMTIVSRKTNLTLWALCCAAAALSFLVFAGLSASAGRGPLMPLDDAYIHFQYARQLAAGQPYVYNPGLPPTSGATSFAYPYLLAGGYLLGFVNENLALWAAAIGALMLALSAWCIVRIGLTLGATPFVAGVVGVGFALSGAAGWHAASGMETLLMCACLLWLLLAMLRGRAGLVIVAAACCALVRPEGAVAAGLAVIVLAAERVFVAHRARSLPAVLGVLRRELRWFLLLLLPVLAVGIQPLVNRLVTGSSVASGSAAKSLFGLIPFDLSYVLGRIASGFTRFFTELADPAGYLWYVGPFLAVLAVIGMVALWRVNRRGCVWLVGTVALTMLAISTLDTAFWHFKRYQMPLIALVWALLPPGIMALEKIIRQLGVRRLGTGLAVAGLLLSVALSQRFIPAYAANIGYVAAQPRAMADWLAENTPVDAVVAVHDVGAMRYFGGRTTLDIVGLTTPGAADYWRSGVGSVGEYIALMRPDYIASYGQGHGLGLGYLADSDLYANPLIEFTVAADPLVNVALAADTQGIYVPDYSAAERAALPLAVPQISPYLDGMTLIETVNVADVADERAAAYDWRLNGPTGSFPSEYYAFETLGCSGACRAMEGGRRINGTERFTVNVQRDLDAVLVTRLHPMGQGSYEVWANGARVGVRVVPMMPGAWLEVPLLIPAALVTDDELVLEIRPLGEGTFYAPYRHWLYQGAYARAERVTEPVSAFGDGSIMLADVSTELAGAQVDVALTWQTGDALPTGDFSIFVHVLDADGNIAVQADRRPGNGALPPGNWLPGTLTDTFALDASALPAGEYRVMIGLYDPVSFARLTPTGGDEFSRLLIGSFTVN